MDFVQFSRTIVQVVMSRFYNCFAMDMILLTCLCSGQRVVVQEKKEDQVVENVVTIQGLTSSGYLLAIGDDYQMCELHPDGNSLDFFKGLIKSKLV
uniref:Biotin protein ligase C-terminal domain-containing protein n=1 Tax=Cucumis sativus TaxID=3659 RepID=A0A0A0LDB6_CUCSA